MRVRGDVESVNLATGSRHVRQAGDGESRLIKTLGDCAPDGGPECFHCGKPLPKSAKAGLHGKFVLVLCPACGCSTPFDVTGE